ncbi:MAG: hypothetical protein FWG16_02100 [Micrococcales bacterium]|nr:hypothetical protein [Micrococcales bacterium]
MIAAAALVAAGALVFMALRGDDKTPPSPAATAQKPDTPPTEEPPQPPESPVTPPTPEPSDNPEDELLVNTDYAADMLIALDNQDLVMRYWFQMQDEMTFITDTYTAALDGQILHHEAESEMAGSSETLREIYHDELINTYVWHYDETWNQEIVGLEACSDDVFCQTPAYWTFQVADALRDLARAAIDQGTDGRLSRVGDREAVGYIIEDFYVPYTFNMMGATDVILWIDTQTKLPLQVNSTISYDHLRGVIFETDWEFVNTVMGNGCIDLPVPMTGDTCLAEAVFEWDPIQPGIRNLLVMDVPEGYEQVDPEYHQGD